MIKSTLILAVFVGLTSVSVVTAAAENNETVIRPDETIINAKGERLVCRTTKKTHSRFMRRECLKQEDWDKQFANFQREWHERTFLNGGVCSQPGTC